MNTTWKFIEMMRKQAGVSMAHETITHIRDEYSTYHWIWKVC